MINNKLLWVIHVLLFFGNNKESMAKVQAGKQYLRKVTQREHIRTFHIGVRDE